MIPGFIAVTGLDRLNRRFGNSEARNSGCHASGTSSGIMHSLKGALVVVMALGAMLVSVQRAAAATAEGSLLTNMATATPEVSQRRRIAAASAARKDRNIRVS